MATTVFGLLTKERKSKTEFRTCTELFAIFIYFIYFFCNCTVMYHGDRVALEFQKSFSVRHSEFVSNCVQFDTALTPTAGDKQCSMCGYIMPTLVTNNQKRRRSRLIYHCQLVCIQGSTSCKNSPQPYTHC